MKVYKDRDTYKIAKAAGPTHNYLGLVLDVRLRPNSPIIKAISTNQHGNAASISSDEVLRQVVKEVSDSNREFDCHFCVSAIEYMTTDTPDDGIYALLAKRIVEVAAKESSTLGE